MANIRPYASCHRDHNNKNEKSKADYREITLFPIYSTTLLPLPEGSHDSDRRLAFSVVAHSTFARAVSVSFRAVQRRSLRTGESLLLEGRACSCACVEVFGERGRGEKRDRGRGMSLYFFFFLDTYWRNSQKNALVSSSSCVKPFRITIHQGHVCNPHTRSFVTPVPPYTGEMMYIKNVYNNVYEEK